MKILILNFGLELPPNTLVPDAMANGLRSLVQVGQGIIELPGGRPVTVRGMTAQGVGRFVVTYDDQALAESVVVSDASLAVAAWQSTNAQFKQLVRLGLAETLCDQPCQRPSKTPWSVIMLSAAVRQLLMPGEAVALGGIHATLSRYYAQGHRPPTFNPELN